MKTSRIKEIKLIFLVAVAAVVFISLISFDRGDVRLLTSDPNPSKQNFAGFIGAYLGWFLKFTAGYGAYALVFFLVVAAFLSFLEEEPRKNRMRLFGTLFSLLAISSIFSLTGAQEITYRFQRGGIVGLAFSDFLLKYLGTAGTFVVIILLLLLSVIVTTDFLMYPFFFWLARFFKSIPKALGSFVSGIFAPRPGKRQAKKQAPAPFAPGPVSIPAKTASLPDKPRGPEKIAGATEKIAGKKPPSPKPDGKKDEETLPFQKSPAHENPYELPPPDLLNTPPPAGEREIKEDLKENSNILEDTLRDFGVEAKVVKVSKGPVITRYELEPAPGVKVHKITSLNDNIALAMKSISVRIVAPIPGKGTVGVEVPNLKSTLVYLREVLDSKEYKESSSKLKLGLGKDISGSPIITDLDDMPHLLIAGTTGSGKTVCVNSIIATLLFNASPEELRFLMVDPKRVELAVFNDLPHLLAPVVTEAKKASCALNWIVSEMERRLDLFTEIGVRNIAGYREREKTEDLQLLPYIVVIIDELHDLMLVAPQEVEDMIMRIAQLSRAVGIHMIIATQRPSVNVITGVIKANLPSRISFKVASKVDSRTVLDMNGAEKLLGKGDMLFIEPGNPKPIRLQGTLVTDQEIKKLTDFIKAQRKPDFVSEIIKVESKTKGKTFEKDEIYEEAVKLVLQTKQASVSMLQRRLGVGYTRAARLIDMMEDEGIVGPYQGSKPRDILLDNVAETR